MPLRIGCVWGRMLVVGVATLLVSFAGRAGVVSLVWSSTTGSGTTGGSSIDADVGDVLELDVVVTADAAQLSAASLSLAYPASVVSATAAAECPPSPLNPFPGVCAGGLAPVTVGVGSSAVALGGADFDLDGKVGLPDFALFRAAFFVGSVPPAAPAFDFDSDGDVDATDYAMFFIPAFGAPGVAGFPPGAVQMIEAQHPAASVGNGTSLTLGRVTFEAVGAGSGNVSVFHLAGYDGFVDGTHTFSTAGYPASDATITVATPPPTVPGLSPATGLLALLIVAGLRLGIDSRRRRASP